MKSLKDEEDEEPPVKKRRGRRAAPSGSNTQRQTRASTRSDKAGSKQGAVKKLAKMTEEDESDDEMNYSRDRSLGFFENGVDDGSFGDDVFGSRRHVAQGECDVHHPLFINWI